MPAIDLRLAEAALPVTEKTPAGTWENPLVVGVGASAGGLDACRKLVEAIPAGTGMAFVLVQHLDPTHASLMAELLASHTAMKVQQAADGMALAPDHLYVIPPGRYLTVARGVLHVSPQGEWEEARQGARLPFDHLLHALAADQGARAACVVMSGTGADGSAGLRSIKAHGGLVIVQDPEEAQYDGMPRSAIATGAVDLVLPASAIGAALLRYQRGKGLPPQPPTPAAMDRLPDIIALLRTRTAHDFTQYKPGTLRRRIERRMAMQSIDPAGVDRYLELLARDPDELEQLFTDLLINVTCFFRDPNVFEFLAASVIPEMVRAKSPGEPLRIWIAGSSTGEEAYSLAILFREALTAAQRHNTLQVFASDVDPDAIATARAGLYPPGIAADVSASRLARFFVREPGGFRVAPDLRAVVVFTVQDVLTDAPFARIDMVSCRNLLIYLQPQAQARVTALFHFALREGGILLLGASETLAAGAEQFEFISRQDHIYRHSGRSRPGELGLAMGLPAIAGPHATARTESSAPARPVALGELCRRLVLEYYAPAAVLINRRFECLFLLGPTDRYLKVPQGLPTHDLLTLARPRLRATLRAAIEQAGRDNMRVTVSAGTMRDEYGVVAFDIVVHPVRHESEKLLLICFVDGSREAAAPRRGRAERAALASAVPELERELEVTRTELHSAVRELEASVEQQKAINEEALSVNEEYQSTNEELLTSKEELQSVNEELTALNSQLQESLERQRTTASDLQNVLYSTDIATLFLDTALNIRFFTPATRALFNVIATDIGRPLADLRALAADATLLVDAATILKTPVPIEREIATDGDPRNCAWYLRRVLPYRGHDDRVQGVVITFTDITERRRATAALEAARQQADLANLAKSRFLAAVSHDLRQPLQTLVLLQTLLARKVEGEEAGKLVALLQPTLSAMSGMLNTLLDINQIDSGTVEAAPVDFAIDDMMRRLGEEFAYHAQAKQVALRLVPSSAIVHSDPRLLEQILRNLLSNAVKYTASGKILFGCQRRGAALSIEVWDTGIGIPEAELDAIFEEYHQVDNAARQRSRGLGLGLPIVRRLAQLLGHTVVVRSWVGRGSMFAIQVGVAGAAMARPDPPPGTPRPRPAGPPEAGPAGAIMVVEDDPELRDLLAMLLTEHGHHVATAPDSAMALEQLAHAKAPPDLILADYNLPGGCDGLLLAAQVRRKLARPLPVVILTGDISTPTLRAIASQDCAHLNKPVQPRELMQTIARLLAEARRRAARLPPAPGGPAVIYLVDDDSALRGAMRRMLEEDGRLVEDFDSGEAFLAGYQPGRDACLLVDAFLPGMQGLELLRLLAERGMKLPAIMITGRGDVPVAVQAMKAGASDFIEKPVDAADLRASIDRALDQARDSNKLAAARRDAADHLAGLTARQVEIMTLVLAGHPSKNIAVDLDISQRTVENHRAAIMRKTGARSLPELARLALAGERHGTGETGGAAEETAPR